MIQLIATVFCFFAAGFWYYSAAEAETDIGLFFNLWFAFAFSGFFILGSIILGTN